MREVLDALITVENRFPNDFLIYIAISLLSLLNENISNSLNFIYSRMFFDRDKKEIKLSRKFSSLNPIKFRLNFKISNIDIEINY